MLTGRRFEAFNKLDADNGAESISLYICEMHQPTQTHYP